MSAEPAVNPTGRPALLRTLDVRAEARRILSWWASHTVDAERGGFYGEVDAGGRPVAEADKGAVLNARLLWFFSAMARHFGDAGARDLAHRAFDYLVSHFVDLTHGGIYWSVDAAGHVANSRKQAYAQAFAVYAMAEYHAATGSDEALTQARWLQAKIEGVFWDTAAGGYVEAKSRDWGPLADQRLSERDLDCPKTMNTHLHILEAYSRLHQAAPDAVSGAALRRVLEVVLTRFIDDRGRHLNLFFDMDWTNRTHSVSFGHDIEASWLIHEAAEALGDGALIARARPVVLGLAEATLAEGVLDSGAVAHDRDFDGRFDPDGEWWGQAEGLVGFTNAWQMTGNTAYAAAAERLWAHIARNFAADPDQEWTWYAAGSPHLPLPLASQWKCPYHNGRTMLELDRRLNR